MPNLKIAGVPNNLKNTVYPFKYNDFKYLKLLIKKKYRHNKNGIQRNYPPENNFLQK